MKQTIIILSLCTAALCAGCKAKQVVTEEVVQGEVVRFSAKAETVTKVSDKDTNPALSAPQFDQGLSGECIPAGDTTGFEKAYHAVLLGRQSL